ncbi:MAG TPA: hypothetical protein VFH68_03825 [Polyangia bacterium]|nr:hypothetical protein [Polyangia bacterium]
MASLIDAEMGPLVLHRHAPPPPKPSRKFKLPPGVPRGPIKEPDWIRIACAEESATVIEMRGIDDNNPRILEYLATVPHLAHAKYMVMDKKLKKKVWTGKMMSEVDETAWCSCFVTWSLKAANMDPPAYSLAKAWKEYGTELAPEEVKVGAVAVIYKEPTKKTANMTHSGFHVGFYIGGPAESPVLLGGNQSDSVCRKQFHGYEVWYRWPVKGSGGSHKKKHK